MNGYDLSRAWFDFCFSHPEKIKPNHTALYFFAIEHCNRLGWKLKFGMPSQMAMDAIGIKSFKTYTETLTDIINWGFMVMIEKSKNQYSSNIISLTKFDKKLVKSLDKAMILHDSKKKCLGKKCESTYQSTVESNYQSTYQSTSESNYQSTVESIASIDKQETKNKEQRTINNEPVIPSENEFLEYCKVFLNGTYYPLEFSLKAKFEQWVADGWKDGNGNDIKNWKTKIKNTAPYLKPLNNGKQTNKNGHQADVDELVRATAGFLTGTQNGNNASGNTG